MLLVVLAVVATTAGRSWSSNPDDLFSLSLDELTQLSVITTSKATENAWRSPAPITLLTAAEINLLGFETLEQTLEYVTGLSLIRGEGNVFTTMSLRGNTQVNYNTNWILLYDGVPLNNPYAGSFDLAAIPMSAVASIEIVKGANSVLYGSNAINGVVNVRSWAGTDGAPTGNELSAIAGRWGSYGGRLRLMSDQKVKASLFVDYLARDGEPLALHDEFGNEATLRDELESVSLAGQMQSGEFSLGVRYFERGLLNFRTRNFDFSQDNLSRQVSLDLTHRHRFSEHGHSQVRFSYLRWRLDKEFRPEFTNPATGFVWNYLGEYYTVELEAQHHGEMTHVVLGGTASSSFGSRYKSNKGEYDIGRLGNRTTDVALYANGDTYVTDRVKAVFGARFYGSFYSAVEGQISDFTRLSGRAGVVWTAAPDIYLKALYGQGFRVPTYFEKEVASAQVIGNPDLKPETSNSVDLILSAVRGAVQFDINPFYTVIDDRITRVDVDPVVRQNQNAGSQEFYGVEVQSKLRQGQKAHGFLGYAYYRGRAFGENPAPLFVYRHMVTLGGSVGTGTFGRANASFKYLAEWEEAATYSLLNLDYVYFVGPSVRVRLKVDNVFGADVDRPEIARHKDLVPVIPVTREPYWSCMVSWRF